MTRNQRHAAIQRIIAGQDIENQEALKRALEGAGFTVTQSTISRDLKNLGLDRVRGPRGRMIYAESAASRPAQEETPELARVVREFLLEATASGNILVIRTAPGNAPPLAAAIDRARLPSILGTLAGDDTIMAVLSADTKGEAEEMRFKTMAGLAG